MGVGGFSKVVATFNLVVESFNLLMATTRDFWIIPSFRIWGYGLHDDHISCHHKLWPTSLSHPFSFLNSPIGLTGENHYQNITIPNFFKIWLLQVAFLLFISIAIFSIYCFQVGLLLQYVALFRSENKLSLRAKLMQNSCLQWKVNQMVAFTFLYLFFIHLS